MEKQINVYRNEIKYYINKRQAFELTGFLRNNMQLDPNSKASGSYWIRSLYFDTVDNYDYNDKVLGSSIRKKIRLRIYDISTDTVKLEIKSKYNNYILKETANISCEDANKLIKGDSGPLLSYNRAAANKVYAFMHQNLYMPKVIIDYEREAYIYPFQNIRITLDKNVCANFSTFNLFEKDIFMTSLIKNDSEILEIKYDHMLPGFLQRLLSSYTTERSQISKYCLGRDILKD